MWNKDWRMTKDVEWRILNEEWMRDEGEVQWRMIKDGELKIILKNEWKNRIEQRGENEVW